MEMYLDINIKILKDKLDDFCSRNAAFDLKRLLHYYTIDVLGELAFSQSFGVQIADDESLVPPVEEHSLLSATTGAWPSMLPLLKRWLPRIPLASLQNLYAGRASCANLASQCVRRRIENVKEGRSPVRKDILSNLIVAKHPETGARLTQTDLETEAFGFM